MGWLRVASSGLWRFFSSVRVAVVLLMAAIGFLALGTFFPQMPSGLSAGSPAHEAWHAAVKEKFGLLAGFYRSLGLFEVYRSPLFFVLLALLSVNLTVCTLNRLRAIWRTAFGPPRVRHAQGLYEKGLRRTLAREAAEKIGAHLSRRRYRFWQDAEGETIYLYAERNRLARLGTLLTHFGLALIAAGALWSTFGAWREEEIALGAGQVYPSDGFKVRCDGFQVERYEDGRPSDYLCFLTVLEEGREVKRKTVRLNDPLTHRGVSFYLSSYGPAVRVRGQDKEGKPLALRAPGYEEASGEVALAFSGQEGEGDVFIPSRKLTLHVAFSRQGPAEEEPLLYVEGSYPQTGPALAGFVPPGRPVEVEDMTFEFSLDHYVVLQAVYDPGFLPVMAASMLLIAGPVLTFYFPRRSLWVKIAPAGEGQAEVCWYGRREEDMMDFGTLINADETQIKNQLCTKDG
ncbi:MAG: cytochrome c biogenesis protein ResB [Anaerolineae bacterium]